MSTQIERASRDAKTIEKLAQALERASTVDQIKDIRDRAMAVQLYTRKKEGGLAAAQAAGRIVTDATLKIAELYQQELGAQSNGRPSKSLVQKQDLPPGKAAIAKASGIDAGNLSRLGRVLEASDRDIERAKRVIEERGEIVSPGALLKEIAPLKETRAPDYLRGRDPKDYSKATQTLGILHETAEFLSSMNPRSVLRGCSVEERKELLKNGARIETWVVKVKREARSG